MDTAARIPERYVFQETGVGCSEHSDPTCLCDVDLTQYPVTPLRYPPSAVLYSRLAADLCMKEFDKITWDGWAGWLCAITEEAARTKVDGLVKVLAEYREAEQHGATYGGDKRTFHQKAYVTLLAAGYDTPQAAAILNTTPEMLQRLLGRPGSKEGVQTLGLEGLLMMEFMLKDGSLSLPEMARELGCNRDIIRQHGARMNIAPPLGSKGTVQQPHVRASVEKWITAGTPPTQVVAEVFKETGVKVSRNHVLRTRKAMEAKAEETMEA